MSTCFILKVFKNSLRNLRRKFCTLLKTSLINKKFSLKKLSMLYDNWQSSSESTDDRQVDLLSSIIWYQEMLNKNSKIGGYKYCSASGMFNEHKGEYECGINHSNIETIDLFGTARSWESLPPITRHPSGNWSTRDGDNFAYYVSVKFMEKVRVAAIILHAKNAI